jgi:hypothetical protein
MARLLLTLLTWSSAHADVLLRTDSTWNSSVLVFEDTTYALEIAGGSISLGAVRFVPEGQPCTWDSSVAVGSYESDPLGNGTMALNVAYHASGYYFCYTPPPAPWTNPCNGTHWQMLRSHGNFVLAFPNGCSAGAQTCVHACDADPARFGCCGGGSARSGCYWACRFIEHEARRPHPRRTCYSSIPVRCPLTLLPTLRGGLFLCRRKTRRRAWRAVSCRVRQIGSTLAFGMRPRLRRARRRAGHFHVARRRSHGRRCRTCGSIRCAGRPPRRRRCRRRWSHLLCCHRRRRTVSGRSCFVRRSPLGHRGNVLLTSGRRTPPTRRTISTASSIRSKSSAWPMGASSSVCAGPSWPTPSPAARGIRMAIRPGVRGARESPSSQPRNLAAAATSPMLTLARSVVRGVSRSDEQPRDRRHVHRHWV